MQEHISIKQAMENLPTKERVRKGNVTQNDKGTRAQVRYFTLFPLARELNILDAEMEYYHNQYMQARMDALGDMDTQTAQFLMSGNRATVPLPTNDEDWTLADLFNHIIRHLNATATEYVELLCSPVSHEINIMHTRGFLGSLSSQIQYSFAELKKAIDCADNDGSIGVE